MKYGFIKVGVATPAVCVADCAYNAEQMLTVLAEAEKQGVSLLVYPELCLTADSCGDLFLTEPLLRAAEAALEQFLEASAHCHTISIIGLPLLVNDKLYNCAVICQNGEILGAVPKAHLSAEERRCFSPAPDTTVTLSLLGYSFPFGRDQIFSCQTVRAFRFGVCVGEDLLAMDGEAEFLAGEGAVMLACPYAAPELVGRADRRRMMASALSEKALCGVLMAGAGYGESTTDYVYGGHALIAELGTVLAEHAPFDTAKTLTVSEIDTDVLAHERCRSARFVTGADTSVWRTVFDMPILRTVLTRTYAPHPFLPTEADRAERLLGVLSIQSQGLARRIERAYAERCVIGISGGLDSCLALLVAVRAFDMLGRNRRDIIAVTMPCFGTTGRTRSNAEVLCEELGVTLRTVNIADSVRAHFADIGHDETVHNVVFENAQARERTQVLMDMANGENALVIGTGDLSELALGWATYNGDHMSMYGVNADVPKTLVRCLVSYCADRYDAEGKTMLAATLRDIVDTPVSPELLPADEGGNIAQKTEDLVGPYEIHDFYIYYMLRYGMAPDKAYLLAKQAFAGRYDDETLLHWLKNFVRRFFAQQFKRSCLPDGPKVGSVGLSPRGDWHMPSDASREAWMRIVEKL